MSAADNIITQITVALFEKGYAEDQVNAALQSPDSLLEALQRLQSSSAKPSGKALRSSQGSRPSTGPQTSPAKRPNRASSQSAAISSRTSAPPQQASKRASATPPRAPSRPPATPQRSAAKGSAAKIPRARSPGPKMNTHEETCQICFDDVPAGKAVRLGCRHGPYCHECLRRHAEARISAGQIDVPCPECTTKVPERDLRRLMPVAVVERLLSRSLERAVSSIDDLLACPTPNCPMRVVVGEEESGRMHCPTCRKNCCIRCGVQPYHKGLTCAEAAKRLKSGSAADQSKQARLFQQWMMKTGTKQCPKCHAPVSKQNLKNQGTQYSECHKMMCLNCSARFCFKCCALLTDTSTCGCSNDLHGFINPKTGRRLGHAVAKAKAKTAAKAKSAATPKAKVKRPSVKVSAPASSFRRAAGKRLVKAKVKVTARPSVKVRGPRGKCSGR